MAIAGSAALALTFLTVAPAQAGVVECVVFDDPVAPTTITVTDDGSTPTLSDSALTQSNIVIGTRSYPVGVSVTTTDDCLGADTVQARLKNTTGAVKVLNLNYNEDLSDFGPNDEVIDVWDATTRFTNLDRGTWYLQSATVTAVTGSFTIDLVTGAITNDTVVIGAPETAPLPTWKRLNVYAYTSAKVNASPEPILSGRTLTVYASTLRAEGTVFIGNRYAPIQIQYKAPGQGAWRLLKSTTTDRFGKTATTLKPGAKGTWSFRTVVPRRAGLAPSISGTDTVLVK